MSVRNLLAALVVSVGAGAVHAAPLDVVNSGFESPGGDISGTPTGYTGGSGTFNPYIFQGGGGFYSTANSTTLAAAPAALPNTDGTHLGYVNESATTFFFQTLAGPDGVVGNGDDPKYQANTNYTITIANGRRSNGQNFEGSDIGFGTGSGGTFAVVSRDVIASTSENPADLRAPAAGTFTDHTFTLNTANFPAAVGQPITVFFGTTTGVGATDFDRLRVDATAVPEPASMFALVIGAAGLLARRCAL